MYPNLQLSREEFQVAHRIERYFKSDNMTFQDKIFNARLIAQHELEAQYFGNEEERRRILEFKGILDSLMYKVQLNPDFRLIPAAAQNRIGQEQAQNYTHYKSALHQGNAG
ncbi:hypothetical protein [Syntrophomonas palmitatica]|uniref:hypothetical protein n=1 Tax=Syntrophomonas palmitatica TaxID=402877 RepID=UPI0012EE45EA|nr:hypothetical protein [Syntrophomonas palmitatica]